MFYLKKCYFAILTDIVAVNNTQSVAEIQITDDVCGFRFAHWPLE